MIELLLLKDEKKMARGHSVPHFSKAEKLVLAFKKNMQFIMDNRLAEFNPFDKYVDSNLEAL